MPPKSSLPTHDSPGVTLLKFATLHHTDGHYKYYYIWLYTKGTQSYIEKKWGRIGSTTGSANVTPGSTTVLGKEFNTLVKSKKDKGYQEVNLKNLKVSEPPPERVIGLSRFRDIA